MTIEPRLRRSLTVHDHARDVAGMQYVYPVVSRRARGVSIGVNLNPNRACNWRCVYCQVPGLVRGAGPAIDLERLEHELAATLAMVLHGDFMQAHVPEELRRLNDVAFSGDGEPTTCPDFRAAVGIATRLLAPHREQVRLVLITNGTQVHRAPVQATLAELAHTNGEVWFKLDAASRAGGLAVNGVAFDPERHLARLERSARLCPTFVQTCLFARRGMLPAEAELERYVTALAGLVARGVPLAGVHLYTLARPSQQPEASELAPLDEEWLSSFAVRLAALGLAVDVSAADQPAKNQ